jgi:Domain of unknown function (DUF397)
MLADEPQLRNLLWRKATHSTGNGACVEVASVGGLLAVRDSQNPTGPVVLCTPSNWQAFLSKLRTG